MLKYWLILIAVVLTPFIIVGVIVFKGADVAFLRKEVYLNTSEMKEVDTAIIIRPGYSSIVAVYTFDHKKTNSITPSANVFIISCFKDSLRKSADTIVLIDTKPQGPFKPERIGDYWFEMQDAERLRGCEIRVPEGQVHLLKKYKYKYATVQLVTDD